MTDDNDEFYLSMLNMHELYDEVVQRLENDDYVGNPLMLSLLKQMGRPKDTTAIQDGKKATMDAIKWDLIGSEISGKSHASIIKEFLIQMTPANKWQRKLEAEFVDAYPNEKGISGEKIDSAGLTTAYKKIHGEAVKLGYIIPNKSIT